MSSTSGCKNSAKPFGFPTPLQIEIIIGFTSVIPWMLAKIGQNSIGELLKRGSPSILKFKCIFMLDDSFGKIFVIQLTSPLCQYCPPARLSICTIRGVLSKALLSLGKDVNPKEINIFNNADIALCLTRYSIAHDLSAFDKLGGCLLSSLFTCFSLKIFFSDQSHWANQVHLVSWWIELLEIPWPDVVIVAHWSLQS